MIALLRGTVHTLAAERVTILVNGVGYECHCTRQCAARLTPGAETSIVIHTEMRDSSISLYGFADEVEKQVFLLLTRVKGVGARSASDILSMIDKQDLLRCIGTSDVTRLQTLKGIGKKTAERIIVELRDKVSEFVSDAVASGMVVERLESAPMEDAAEALVALGFSRRDAEKALAQVDMTRIPSVDSGGIVREALRFI